MEFCCASCDYSTHKRFNYDKHLSSKKHHKNKDKPPATPMLAVVSPVVSPMLATPEPVHKCKYCDQCYKHRSSLSKHIKYSCTKNKDEDLKELVRLMNVQLEQQKNEIVTQSKQIEKLKGKLEIHGSFNTTINNHVQILNYKDTDTSHLTDEDYRKCVKKVCFCVLKMIEKIHFNPEKPENMNIYISNIKDKYLMIYENDKWILKSKNVLDQMYEDKELMIEEWIQETRDPEMSRFYNRYLDLKKDEKTIEMIQEEIKLFLFNQKELVTSQKKIEYS
jgi:hypothetical protein